MDSVNFDEWLDESCFNGQVFDQNSASMDLTMPGLAQTHTDLPSVGDFDPTLLTFYDQQSMEYPEEPLYKVPEARYDTVCPSQLMMSANGAQNSTQGTMVSASSYYPIDTTSTIGTIDNSQGVYCNDPSHRFYDSSSHQNVFPSSGICENQPFVPSLGSLQGRTPLEVIVEGSQEGSDENEQEMVDSISSQPADTMVISDDEEEKTTSREPGPREPSDLLSAPLSLLARHVPHIPIEDLSDYVERDVRQRRRESTDIRRARGPCNQFVLYCRAYRPVAQELIKRGFIQQDDDLTEHHFVNRVCGASWQIEVWTVRNEYQDLAVIDKELHLEAFPPKPKPKKNRGNQMKVQKRTTRHSRVSTPGTTRSGARFRPT